MVKYQKTIFETRKLTKKQNKTEKNTAARPSTVVETLSVWKIEKNVST